MSVRVAVKFPGRALVVVETQADSPRAVARWARGQEGVERTKTEGDRVLIVMKEGA